MSSEKTQNLNLHKWGPTDYVLRTEWNDNFETLDEGFSSLAVSNNEVQANVLKVPEMTYKGVNFTSITSGEFQSQRASNLLTYFNGLGGNSVAIVVTWFQDTSSSTTISRHATKTVPDVDVIAAIRKAKALGMKVMLKPHVDVNDGSWRGEIIASDWAAWFASYQTFINTYATIAQAEGVDLLCVGTELAKASSRTSDWQTVISNIRSIYNGQLTYAATAFKGDGLDEFVKIQWWNSLDFAGLDAYFPMTGKIGPAIDEITLSWSNNKNGVDVLKLITDWQKTHGKPVLFTEIGCTNIAGANQDPAKFDWSNPVTSNQEQADYVEAMFQVLSANTDFLVGFFWWRLAFNSSDRFAFENRPAGEAFRKYMSVENKKVASLPKTAHMGGYNVLNVGNHNNLPNPHPQYVQLSPYRTAETNSSTKNQWTKVGSVTLTAQYKYATAKLSFMSGASANSASQRCTLSLRIKQQGTLGNAPMISLRVRDYANISPEDLKAITVQNDSAATKIDLYVKVRDEFDRLFFNPYHIEKNTTGVTMTWLSDQAFTTSLPAGTETVGIQDISFVKAYHTSSQSLTGGQFNKIAFSTELNDYRSEYDPTTSKFTAGQSGVYLIKACVRLTSPSSQQRSMGVYVNGVYSQRLGNGSNGAIVDGFAPVKLLSGDTVEIYLNTPDNVTVEGNQQDTYLSIVSTV